LIVMSTYQTRDGKLQVGYRDITLTRDDYDTMDLYLMRKRWTRDKRHIGV